MAEAFLEQEKEQELNEWRRTRQICWMIYQANVDPKKAVKRIEDFMNLGETPLVKKARKPSKKIQEMAALLNAKLNKK